MRKIILALFSLLLTLSFSGGIARAASTVRQQTAHVLIIKHTPSSSLNIPNSLVSCSEDSCDGILPAYNKGFTYRDYANCTGLTLDYGLNMIDDVGAIAGHIYIYSDHSAPGCYDAFWSTVKLNTGYSWPAGQAMYVYNYRTSAGEVKNEWLGYNEPLQAGSFADAPMLGYEDYPHASDCMYGQVIWTDQYSVQRTTTTPTFCYGG